MKVPRNVRVSVCVCVCFHRPAGRTPCGDDEQQSYLRDPESCWASASRLSSVSACLSAHISSSDAALTRPKTCDSVLRGSSPSPSCQMLFLSARAAHCINREESLREESQFSRRHQLLPASSAAAALVSDGIC